MLHEPLGDDLGHNVVGVVDPLAAVVVQREGDGQGQFGGSSGETAKAGSGGGQPGQTGLVVRSPNVLRDHLPCEPVAVGGTPE